MRRGRRGGHGGPEFGGSGEDSFVAVVVTKLTGALLFILLLTMVIMALIPRGEPGSAARKPEADAPAPLAITTPEALPEAIVGRPYTLALAATGGAGPLRWSVAGELPEGLSLDPATGVLSGTPRRGTREPAALTVRVGDGQASVTRSTRLVVYQPTTTLATPSWLAAMPAVPVRAWLERGIGFLVLLLVHLVGMNAVRSLDAGRAGADADAKPPRRLALYRATVRLATLSAMLGLAAWLWTHRGA
jgi:hypothetical protein